MNSVEELLYMVLFIRGDDSSIYSDHRESEEKTSLGPREKNPSKATWAR